MAKNLVRKSKYYIQYPATANQHDNANGQKLGNYRQGHIAYGSDCLKQRHHYTDYYTCQQNRTRHK
jgi:hypothetical protein